MDSSSCYIESRDDFNVNGSNLFDVYLDPEFLALADEIAHDSSDASPALSTQSRNLDVPLHVAYPCSPHPSHSSFAPSLSHYPNPTHQSTTPLTAQKASIEANWDSLNASADQFLDFGPHGSAIDANPTEKQPILTASYERKQGMTSQMSRQIPDVLPDDKDKNTIQKNKSSQLWFFMLTLLVDPSKKTILQWTGNQREFRVHDENEFMRLWAQHKGTSIGKWSTIQRTLRDAARKLILMAVPSTTNKGRNEPGLFKYAIEPSSYVKMTREELDEYIKVHCEKNSPQITQDELSSMDPLPMPLNPIQPIFNLPPQPIPQYHLNSPINQLPLAPYPIHPNEHYYYGPSNYHAAPVAHYHHHINIRYNPY